jgi:ABC-type uncharacterized transport system permease subunit
MVRSIVAVVVGYIVLALCIFISFSLLYLMLGADGSFQAGSYRVSMTWLAASLVLGLIAAILAGFVCARVAQNSKVPLVLAGIVLVLGILFAIPVITSTTDPVRDTNVGNLEAMQNAKQPGWIALLNPVLGAVGIAIGARLSGAKPIVP